VRQEIGKAEILVYKTHMRADTQRFGHLDQAFPVHFTLLKLDLRMGGAHDQINGPGQAATILGMA